MSLRKPGHHRYRFFQTLNQKNCQNLWTRFHVHHIEWNHHHCSAHIFEDTYHPALILHPEKLCHFQAEPFAACIASRLAYLLWAFSTRKLKPKENVLITTFTFVTSFILPSTNHNESVSGWLQNWSCTCKSSTFMASCINGKPVTSFKTNL